MDPVSIALGLASIAPTIVRWITGSDTDAAVAQKVVDVAKTVAGKDDANAAVEAIKADPKLALQFQQAWLSQELALFQEETKRLAEVNATMRAEAQSSDPWTRRWRPFWGFASAVAFFIGVVGILALAAIGVATHNADLLEIVPQLVADLAELFAIPGAILGIASWHRGKMQREQVQARAGKSLPVGRFTTALKALGGG